MSGKYGHWTMADPTIRLTRGEPPAIVDHIEPIAGGLADRPSPTAIANFMRTVRGLNNSIDPDEDGPLAEVWRWLKGLANG